MSHDVTELARILFCAENALTPLRLNAASDDGEPGRGGPSSFVVSKGLPWLNQNDSCRWVDDRIFVFPFGVPTSKRISIVSSRLRQRLDLETWWFDLLRTATLHCDSEDDLLVTAEATAACSATARAALLFGRKSLHFRPIGSGTLATVDQLADWLQACQSRLQNEDQDLSSMRSRQPVFVSPLLQTQQLPTQQPSKEAAQGLMRTIPLGDRLLFAASDRTYVLSLRDSGHVESLLQMHLQDRQRQQSPVLIASNQDGALPNCSEQLPNGWVPWLVEPLPQQTLSLDPLPLDPLPLDPPQGRASRMSSKRQSESFVISNGYHLPRIRRAMVASPANNPLSQPNDWLLHWTRPSAGPWPGESMEEYLDSLLLRTAVAERSALATLLRIVSSGRLLGSKEGIRGSYQVVALTSVPLAEFSARRTFRKHRHRFDFEPWGVAFRKTALAERVRQVIYGDDATWASLPEDQRPWFQKATFGGATNNVAECEWRVVGDLCFQDFDATNVCVFVASRQAAEIISQHCDLGVVIVPD